MSKNRNKKWVVLESLLILLLFSFSRAYADGNQEYHPDCEKGDAIFRRLRIIYNIGHCGIYLNNASYFENEYPQNTSEEELSDINNAPITVVDGEQAEESKPENRNHCDIQADGYRHKFPIPQPERLKIRTFEGFMGGHSQYWGAFNSGGLKADQRRKLVRVAWKQRGCNR